MNEKLNDPPVVNKCLNCDTVLRGRFCHNCGQKATTHRITFSRFIEHDLVHGVFHLDKGIFYTLRTLLYSPGYAVKSFISGKRVMHYNIFALFIIIVALKTFVDSHLNQASVFDSINKDDIDASVNRVISQYYKFLYLLSIPMLSVFSWLFFRKLHFNYTEHIVFNCFILTGGFFYGLILSVIFYFAQIEDSRFYSLPIILVYLLVGYFQSCKGVYPFFGYLWRTLTILVLFLLSLIIAMVLVLIFAYGGSFEGKIAL